MDSSEHAKKIVQNNVEFFTCNHLPRSEMPRYLAVVEHALVRVKEVSAGPGIDSEIVGHLYEVGNALVDVKGLIEKCVNSIEARPMLEINYLKGNVERIDRAINGLQSIAK
ncbi:hypothetical protein DBB42_26275 [Pseudomonas plecoglossicida]|uniref:Uncharacterized protein n=2 Tax=Pseudomonas plecoglossicida TaxID=70775 RepID=A0A2R7UDQ7_PSEDL|nr:hypothetical protein DBB42_26275 [Pseudomonas plecoglossicida]